MFYACVCVCVCDELDYEDMCAKGKNLCILLFKIAKERERDHGGEAGLCVSINFISIQRPLRRSFWIPLHFSIRRLLSPFPLPHVAHGPMPCDIQLQVQERCDRKRLCSMYGKKLTVSEWRETVIIHAVRDVCGAPSPARRMHD